MLAYGYIQYMFAVSIAFMCIYYADRIPSAIANFLVYLFGKGRGRVKWERGGGKVEEQWAEKGEGMHKK